MNRIFLLSLLIGFCGCKIIYPLPKFLPNVSPHLISESGFITQKVDSLNITVGHLETTNLFWVFSFRVINRSHKPVLVNPDEFYYRIINEESRSVSIPYFAHSRAYLLNHAKIQFGQTYKYYKDLVPRLVNDFDQYIFKKAYATDTLALDGLIYFPKQPINRGLLFNFKIDTMAFETPFVLTIKSPINIQQD